MVRIEPGKNGKKKDFRQRRRGKDGKWIWNLKGIERVLYRLPEVIGAPLVLVVEGEKCVEILRNHGFASTTSPMGAGKWVDSYSRYLSGKQVVLIPDNDDPGKNHMTKVATSLNSMVAELKMLILPGLSPKEDVYDFISRFDDPTEATERLSVMIDGCPPYIPPEKRPTPCNGRNNALKCLTGLRVEKEYTVMLGQEEWYLPNLIIKNQIVVIIAKAGGGKTAIMFEFVAPWVIKCHGVKCLYLDCDSPASDHKRMFERAEEIGDKFHWINPLTHGKGPDDIIGTLRQAVVEKQRFDDTILFFDTLKKFLNVMDKRSVKPFFELMRQLISLGATIVLLGHANKYRSPDGNLIFEGVGDIQSDTDALIFFEAVSTPDGIDVTTVVDPDRGAKVRGLYEPISFHIERGTRIVTQHEEAVEVPDWTPGAKGKLTDEEIEDLVRQFLQGRQGHVKQLDIIKGFKSISGVSDHGLRRVLAVSAVHENDASQAGQIFYSVGPHNSKAYSVVD
ncbi:hypothetical protein [Desulfosarcina variabilis]|uniref:hypothetical protein n=1 Tax=Desulfosarcina variabilis TaxID=2300 RepID=UPI003AFA0FE6